MYDLCAILSEGWDNTVLAYLLDEYWILDRVCLISSREHWIC